MKGSRNSGFAAAALLVAATSAACEGVTETDREAAKKQAAQEYGECLLESYYEKPNRERSIGAAVEECDQKGREYATLLVRGYRSNYSDVRYNVQSYIYPVVRRQGTALLTALAGE